MRNQLIKWIQINLEEIHSNQDNQSSNPNGKMIIGIKIKVIKSSPVMEIREAVLIILNETVCQDVKRVSKVMTVELWIMAWVKVVNMPIRISVTANTTLGRMNRISTEKLWIIQITGMTMMDKDGTLAKIILLMILISITMRI